MLIRATIIERIRVMFNNIIIFFITRFETLFHYYLSRRWISTGIAVFLTTSKGTANADNKKNIFHNFVLEA